MPDNNRLENRHRRRIQLKYGLDTAHRIGFTEDISEEGFFITTGLVEKPGSLLQFELTMSSGEIVALEGRVRWAKRVPVNLLRRIKGGMGVRIVRFKSGADTYRALCRELTSRT